MVDKTSPNGDRRSASFRISVFDEVYLVHSPLAIATRIPLCEQRGLGETARNQLCAGLFRQCLEGIEYMHSKVVMYRDTKPGNLAIVSVQPIHGRVIDFGSAKIGTSSDNLEVGALPYHAPEMWRIARCSETKGLTYDEKGDLFAFGVSAYQVFCKEPGWWGDEAEKEDLDVMKEDLRSQRSQLGAPLEIKRLITSMLAYDSGTRPSAKDARKLIENARRPGNGSLTPRSDIPYGVDIDSNRRQQYPTQLKESTCFLLT